MVKKHAETKQKKVSPKLPRSYLLAAALLIVGIVLVALFLGNGGEPKKDYSVYNNFEFSKLQNGWQTIVEKDGVPYEAPFYNHPHDISGVVYDDDVTEEIDDVITTLNPKRQLIIAIHPDEGSVPVLAGVNIAKITGKFFGAQTRSALYVEDEELANRNENFTLPTVNCDKANFQNVIIHISMLQNETVVRFSENNDYCIQVFGQNQESILMAADLVGYKLLGIMR